MVELPLASVERVMRMAGAERISNEAVKVVANKAEILIKKLTEKAIELSKHAKRKTLIADDIELASKMG